MGKLVGMSRNIKLQWLNKVVQLVNENYSEKEIKEMLNDYLSFEISSPTNLRKTREILMNIWVYENESNRLIRKEALALINALEECPVEIHWCMILVTYPVFRDMSKLIGKISEFQEMITLSQIKQKLYDEWGERTTLHHSSDKIIATYKDLGVIKTDKPGRYLLNKNVVSNSKIIMLIIFTIMNIEDKSYYSISELMNNPYFYPFEYSISKEAILENPNFVTNNFGGEFSIMAKTKVL